MENKWISVKDELLDDSYGDVLCFMAKNGDCDNGTGYNIIAWYDKGK